jgi:translation initiation factor 2D
LVPVQIVVETRQGRKAVTLVSHVEQFDIDPDSLAKQLQKLCASSTTVSTTATGVNEILVQGRAIKEVTQLLQSQHGIHKK